MTTTATQPTANQSELLNRLQAIRDLIADPATDPAILIPLQQMGKRTEAALEGRDLLHVQLHAA